MTNGPSIEELPTLKGARLMIRPLVEDDIDALFSIFSDPDVTEYMGIPRLKDRDDAAAFLTDIHAGLQSHSLLQWGIESIQWPGVIGTCTLSSISWANRRAEVGFALAPAHWGHGFMTEALPLLVDYAFGTLGLHRLEADVDPRNHRSLRMLQRLGFQIEGHLRQRHRVENEYQDSILLGLLADDWSRDMQTGRNTKTPPGL